MDRKLFFSYIQNMQQNNQDMVGFQNSMRKNSWQKPKSLYEMNGGGHVYQGDFDAYDRGQEPARRADEEGLNALLERPKGKDGKPLKNEDGTPVLSDVEDLAAEAHKEFVNSGGTGHHGIGEEEAHDILRDHSSWRSLSDSARGTAVSKFMAILNDIHDDHMAAQAAAEEAAGRDWYTDRGMTHGDPHNPLRESFIQMNEVKANIRDEYPRTVYSADQDPTASPSGASFDKRKLIGYAAEAALKDENHWIYHPKNHNIRRALFNFTNGNTQTEDLPHIVTFMNQDPKFKKDLEELNADIEKYGHF